MSIRPILIHPDPRLKKTCEPVARITPEIETLAADMLATMYDAPGVGLAAPQVGVLSRVFVMDATKDPDAPRSPMVLVNPEIVWKSDEPNVYEEGCLSIPDYYAEVERPSAVRVKYLDENGKEQEVEADGLLATCLQHEIDHLDGVLFIDYISKLKRDMVLRKFKKLAKDRPPSRMVG